MLFCWYAPSSTTSSQADYDNVPRHSLARDDDMQVASGRSFPLFFIFNSLIKIIIVIFMSPSFSVLFNIDLKWLLHVCTLVNSIKNIQTLEKLHSNLNFLPLPPSLRTKSIYRPALSHPPWLYSQTFTTEVGWRWLGKGRRVEEER